MESTSKMLHFHGKSDLFTDSKGVQVLVRSFQKSSFENHQVMLTIEQDIKKQMNLQSVDLCPFRGIDIQEDAIMIQRRFLPGISLAEELVYQPLDLSFFLSYAHSISRGIQTLHDLDIVAQNIKPENIIIVGNKNIFLVDFGISVLTDDTFHSNPTIFTLLVAGPEGIENGYPVFTKETDIFQLGIIFYVMINGKLPWSSLNLPRISNQIKTGQLPFPDETFGKFPLEIVNLIHQMLSPKPSDRPDINSVLEVINQQQLKQPTRHKRHTLQSQNCSSSRPAQICNNLFIPNTKTAFSPKMNRCCQMLPKPIPCPKPTQCTRKSGTYIMRTRTFSDMSPITSI